MIRDSELEISADQLVEHTAFVRSIARAILVRDDLADDAVQDTFIAAMGKRPRDSSRLRAWLAGIVRNKAQEIRRSETRRAVRERHVVPSEPSMDPNSLAQRAEMGRRLIAHVLALPEPYRHVLLLRFHSALSMRSIASMLDLPEETVRTRQRRGLQRLRSMLGKDEQSKRDWRAALVPLSVALPSKATVVAASTAGGALMSKKVVLGLGALLLLGGTYLALQTIQGERQDVPDREASLHNDANDVHQPIVDDKPPSLAVVAQPESGTDAVKPKTPEPATLREGELQFNGLVVDAKGEPVEGAQLEVHFEGKRLLTLLSDAKGTYSFRHMPAGDIATYRSGWVRARGPTGRVGVGTFDVSYSARIFAPPASSERDITKIVVLPGTTLSLRVTSEAKDALPATVAMVGSSFRMMSTVDSWTTQDDGHLTINDVPAGTWRFIAYAPGCGRAYKVLEFPLAKEAHSEGSIRISIPKAHALRVRVIDKITATPIVGARVSVKELILLRGNSGMKAPLATTPSRYVTDKDGNVAIEGLGGHERLHLQAEAEGYPTPRDSLNRTAQGAARVDPGGEDAVIELERARTVRWPVEDKGRGVPSDGTSVSLRPSSNSGVVSIPKSGIIESGSLVVEGWAPGYASALAYVEWTGSCRLWAKPGSTEGPPIAFYQTRRITLHATRKDGTPATGLFLVARDAGNNLMRQPAPTDQRGIAILDDLSGHPMASANCSVGKTVEDHTGDPLGRVDLHQQDGHFDYVVPLVPRKRVLRLRILVDGKPAPSDFTFSTNLPGLRNKLHRLDSAGVCTVSFTPRTSQQVVGISVASQATQHVLAVYVRAKGYTQVKRVNVGLKAKDPMMAVVDLVELASARVKVLQPKDKRVNLVLVPESHPQSTAALTHRIPMLRRTGQRPDDSGYLTLSAVPGRYRVRDVHTGKQSDPIELAVGIPPAQVTIDLSAAGYVRGQVIVPKKYAFDGFSVAVEGQEHRAQSRLQLPGRGPAGPGTPVNRKDGTFWLRVPGDRDLTLVVHHSMCQAHPTLGRVVVRTPKEGLVLKAIEGRRATLRLAKPIPISFDRGTPRSIAVHLFHADESEGSAMNGKGIALQGRLNGAANEISFGGYEPGTYTIWIDTLSVAPLVLRDVKLLSGSEEIDLGTHMTQPGSNFILRVLVKEGQSPPRIILDAIHKGQPSYTRRIDAASATIYLRGIGAGTFTIQSSPYSGNRSLDEEISFDGTSDVERTIDLR